MAEEETPSWLNDPSDGGGGGASAPAEPSASGGDAPGAFSLDSGPGGAAAAAPAPASNTDSTATSRAAPDASAAPSEEEKDLPSIILVMRLANMAVSIVLIACSVFTMISLPPPATWVLSIYATCGGLLICCLETQLKFLRVMIAMNFGFLFSFFWRFVFYLILGTVAWAYGNLFGQITGVLLGAIALFNTFILLRYPSYRKMREKIAEEEDKRIEARISREVKKQAVRSFAG